MLAEKRSWDTCPCPDAPPARSGLWERWNIMVCNWEAAYERGSTRLKQEMVQPALSATYTCPPWVSAVPTVPCPQVVLANSLTFCLLPPLESHEVRVFYPGRNLGLYVPWALRSPKGPYYLYISGFKTISQLRGLRQLFAHGSV